MKSVEKVIKVEYDSCEDFYNKFLMFLTPVTKLKKREREMLACFIALYYKLKGEGWDDKTVSEYCFLKHGVEAMAQKYDVGAQYVRTLISIYRKLGILDGCTLNPRILVGDPTTKTLTGIAIYLENVGKNE